MNKIITIVFLIIAFLLSACSTKKTLYRTYHKSQHTNKKAYTNKNKKTYTYHKPSSKGYVHPTMRPYVVRGVKYYPTVVSIGDEFRGRASWYGPAFHGKLTSNGETYDMYGMTAAHKTLPMNTIVKVTNLENGLSTVVRVNDRGPFVDNRIIDLSKAAAQKIGLISSGTARVKLEVVGFKNKQSKKIASKTSSKVALDKYALQIGSFSKIEGAMKIQEIYDGKDGYKTLIKDVENKNSRIFKVWLSGFKSEQEARDYKAQGHFENAFIVKEE
jgi:rare lipoprotein A